MKRVARQQIILQEPFSGLFPSQKPVVEAITAAMQTSGFDPGSPLRVWATEGKLVLIDGHMRLQAATKAELEEVCIQEMSFADTRAALLWACQEQGERRRNLTKVEHRKYVHQAVKMLDQVQPWGGDRKSQVHRDTKIKPLHKGLISPRSQSAKATAAIVGTSTSQVEATRRILKHGTEAQIAALANGAGPQVIAKQLAPTRPARRKKTPTPVPRPRNDADLLVEFPKPMQPVLRKINVLLFTLLPKTITPALRRQLGDYLNALGDTVRGGAYRGSITIKL